jgi:hypothetical protein
MLLDRRSDRFYSLRPFLTLAPHYSCTFGLNPHIHLQARATALAMASFSQLLNQAMTLTGQQTCDVPSQQQTFRQQLID